MAKIEAQGLGIDFPLYHGNARSLKRTVLAAASGGRLGRDPQHRIVVQALRDISFTLCSGDRLALIGVNGAGKTTLLRTLAGIYEPTAGQIRVEGSLNALLDPSLGMNPELTGHENILLRGLYARLDRTAIARLEEDIREFAELGDFIDLPVRIYSTGMVVRLAFGLATAIHPEVLVMDEWFQAGDTAFLEKAKARLESVVRKAEILVLSTHMLPIVKTWCTRVIWLDQGRIRQDGMPAEILRCYAPA